MREVVIVSAVRTAIGRLGGALSSLRPDDLAAVAMRAAVERAGLEVDQIDEVVFGCANQAGEDNRNVARMALLLAGLPHRVPGITVNRLCASGLSAVNIAARTIMCGDADVMLAGGVESMSRAPWVMPKAAKPFPVGNLTAYDTTLGWRFPNPKMAEMFPLDAMGVTAENLVDRYDIARGRQDAFAYTSHRKAIAAHESGAFADEIIPVRVPRRKQDDLVVDRDEGPRADSSIEKLAKLRPVFRKGGSVTAGNSSTLNDGAAALVLTTRERAQADSLPIMAQYVASASAGVDPTVMGIGPVPAMRKALQRADWSIGDLALVELNEAFSAQSLAVIDALELDIEKVNVNGGAIALGHPLGCSGARILTTLLQPARRRGGGRGGAALCVGVGQGVATLIDV